MGATGGFAAVVQALALLGARLALAVPFLRSGLAKWDGFLELSPGTVPLFTRYRLHVLDTLYAIPYPEVVAMAVAVAEVAFPVLLVIGLITRFSAFATLALTVFVYLLSPAAWLQGQIFWAALSLVLIGFGGGILSLDRVFFGRRY